MTTWLYVIAAIFIIVFAFDYDATVGWLLFAITIISMAIVIQQRGLRVNAIHS